MFIQIRKYKCFFVFFLVLLLALSECQEPAFVPCTTLHVINTLSPTKICYDCYYYYCPRCHGNSTRFPRCISWRCDRMAIAWRFVVNDQGGKERGRNMGCSSSISKSCMAQCFPATVTEAEPRVSAVCSPFSPPTSPSLGVLQCRKMLLDHMVISRPFLFSNIL